MPLIGASGSLLATSAEQTLATVVTNANYVLVVDASVMLAGDVLTLRLKREALNGGTRRTLYQQTWTGVQAVPMKASVPVPGPYGVQATLQQQEGTGRTYPWSLETL
jgi:hypothetical protein